MRFSSPLIAVILSLAISSSSSSDCFLSMSDSFDQNESDIERKLSDDEYEEIASDKMTAMRGELNRIIFLQLDKV